MMLYFAYGSNMDWEQMRVRCPSARFVCVARLPEHRLDFTRRSKRWCGGVADVVPDAGDHVWGVVYQIDETDVGALDTAEGFRPGRPRDRNAYIREERHVYRGGEGQAPLATQLYVVVRRAAGLRPGREYHKMLVEAAEYWHLPADYVAKLGKIEVAE